MIRGFSSGAGGPFPTPGPPRKEVRHRSLWIPSFPFGVVRTPQILHPPFPRGLAFLTVLCELVQTRPPLPLTTLLYPFQGARGPPSSSFPSCQHHHGTDDDGTFCFLSLLFLSSSCLFEARCAPSSLDFFSFIFWLLSPSPRLSAVFFNPCQGCVGLFSCPEFRL